MKRQPEVHCLLKACNIRLALIVVLRDISHNIEIVNITFLTLYKKNQICILYTEYHMHKPIFYSNIFYYTRAKIDFLT